MVHDTSFSSHLFSALEGQQGDLDSMLAAFPQQKMLSVEVYDQGKAVRFCAQLLQTFLGVDGSRHVKRRDGTHIGFH